MARNFDEQPRSYAIYGVGECGPDLFAVTIAGHKALEIAVHAAFAAHANGWAEYYESWVQDQHGTVLYAFARPADHSVIAL